MGSRERRCLMVFLDLFLINAALLGAFYLRFERIRLEHLRIILAVAAPGAAVRLLINYFFGLYHRAWEYASIEEVAGIAASATLGTIFNGLLLFFAFQYYPPRSILLLIWILNIAFLGVTRLSWRILRRGGPYYPGKEAKKVLLVGAGDGGVLVARELENHYGKAVKIVGFIDDDPGKQGQQILGYSVLGGREDLCAAASRYNADEIIISMPSVPRKKLRQIVSLAQTTGKQVKILPGVFDLIEGNVTVQQIRQVELEDLLGRDPVEVDLERISSYLENQVVLVTGAGGSIGSELCRQLMGFSPAGLLLLDISENDIYQVELELRQRGAVPLQALVKDIRDRAALKSVFQQYRPAVVFHAAAHKHVPLMEANPEEAIKNNVQGTYEIAWAAHKYGARKFVLVSTDKAVNPSSVMGASKRIAEMIVQHLNTISSTNYAAVRFGNVLGSRGSVIPLFRRQILAGGPVTVTHEKMIRYFMTIPEAVQLIIQAGALASGGEIFLLDMGEPVRILDLAETLIRLSGFEPYSDIEIEITGIRPGEKLYEELLTPEEGVEATAHRRIFAAKPCQLPTELIEAVMAGFSQPRPGGLPSDLESSLNFIRKFLPEFKLVRPRPRLLETAAASKEE